MSSILAPRRPRRRARAIQPVPLPEGKPLAQQERAEHRDSVYHIYMAALAMLAILVSVGLFLSPTEPDVIGVLSVVDSLLVLRDGAVERFGPRAEVMAAMSGAARPAPASNVVELKGPQ